MADTPKYLSSLLAPEIESFLQGQLPARPKLLREMEARAKREDFPIIGPQAGALLAMLVRISGVKSVFEMGSGFGYSGAWIISALPPGGSLMITDGSAMRLAEARASLSQIGSGANLTAQAGDSLEILERQSRLFDMVFCDVEKESYPDAFKIASGLLHPGGLFVCDNTLWHGEVARKGPLGPETRAVTTMNQMIFGHPDFDAVHIPLHDGMIIARRHGPAPALPLRPGEKPRRRSEDRQG